MDVNSTLVDIVNMLGVECYIATLDTRRVTKISDSGCRGMTEINKLVDFSLKHQYSLINVKNHYAVLVQLNINEMCVLIPDCDSNRNLEMDMNVTSIIFNIKRICRIIFEVYNQTPAPSAELHIETPAITKNFLTHDQAVQEINEIKQLNDQLLKTFLNHDEVAYKIVCAEIISNSYIVSELQNVDKARMLMHEYVFLLIRGAVCQGYPATELGVIKKRLYSLITKLDDTINLRYMLNQLFLNIYTIIFGIRKTVNKTTMIKKYIDYNISGSVKLADISLATGIHIKKLNIIFKKAFATTIHQYVRDKKLSIAKNLLIETELSIQDIVDIVGFSDKSHFITSFKKSAGMTPQKFRQEIHF